MKCVTRENANVDRIACPWLIRRFIDPDAEFLFVGRDEVLPVAEREGAHSYDARHRRPRQDPARDTDVRRVVRVVPAASPTGK